MKRVLAVLAVAVLAALALVWFLNIRGEDKVSSAPPAAAPAAQQVARGAYLATVGNCAGCHTARGAVAYAGGRGIETPFGILYSTNLTPDRETGIGNWSADHFWRALHNGRSRDGRLLYPAFPYPNYTAVTRADSDALFDFLRSQAPVRQAAKPHELGWPFSSQAALAIWRALYFRPGSHVADVGQSADWNRGAYLVEGLGHCSACHTQRNALGASSDMLDLSGGLIPMQNWYAPSLTSPAEAGVSDWPLDHVVRVMQSGISPRGTVLGPMADVVLNSTQHWNAADLRAMAVFLKALPQKAPEPAFAATAVDAAKAQRGAKLYEQHCAQCHGEQGQGVVNAYPPLAGNRAVLLQETTNLVQVVLYGGFPPATAGNPRPFGMPPYVLQLNDSDVAALLTHLRASWGNRAAPVSEVDVVRKRGGAQ